ncbi:hypothetical protein [Photobacterium aquae]|uniref:hypothetical protein n=1 Tax=Photobacterium aquae TaxID=1195763 RepID=UPI00069DA312
MDVEKLIASLRETDRYIETIFMQGSCYQFHLFLKSLYPKSRPLISKQKDHIITMIDDRCYDITGIVSSQGFSELTESDLQLVKSWSFSKYKILSLGECPCCEEPIIV